MTILQHARASTAFALRQQEIDLPIGKAHTDAKARNSEAFTTHSSRARTGASAVK